MPREANSPKFLEMLFESNHDQENFTFEMHDSENDGASWQSTFLEIDVNPLNLGELKLTRQHGRIYDHEDLLSSGLDL